ncbi:hypothetical protein DPSP01_013412 [Paraphaeosphaeria sporulosa]
MAVSNFEPKNSIKTDVNEFNDYIKRLSQHMSQTYIRLKPTLTPAQNLLYSDLDYTQDRITEARAGDHGPYLIAEARKKIEPKGLIVEVQRLNGGVNPAQAINPGLDNWETVDWAKTIKQRPSTMTIEAASKIVNDFTKVYYGGNKAKQHLTVIRTNKYAVGQIHNCQR